MLTNQVGFESVEVEEQSRGPTRPAYRNFGAAQQRHNPPYRIHYYFSVEGRMSGANSIISPNASGGSASGGATSKAAAQMQKMRDANTKYKNLLKMAKERIEQQEIELKELRGELLLVLQPKMR